MRSFSLSPYRIINDLRGDLLIGALSSTTGGDSGLGPTLLNMLIYSNS